MSTNSTLATTQNGLDSFREHVQLTAASHEVAAKQPIGATVESTIAAAAGNSKQTERAYRKAIFDFLTFLDAQANGVHDQYPHWFPIVEARTVGRRTVYDYNPQTPSAVLWLVNAAVMDTFALELSEQVSQRTVEARVNAVRTFLSVALRDNVITQEQGQQLGLKPYKPKRRRQNEVVGRRLAVAEVKKLRRAIDAESVRGKRDKAILDCMLFAGLRRSEVANLQAVNIVRDQGRYWLQIDGKGSKTRKLKIHDQLYASLTAWMNEAGLTFHDERPIFASVDKWGNVKETQIDPNVIERITAEYATAAQLAPAAGKRKLAPHDLRRTCARNAYDNGATLLQVQQMLGHSDPKTTSAYIGAGQDDDNTAVDCVRY